MSYPWPLLLTASAYHSVLALPHTFTSRRSGLRVTWYSPGFRPLSPCPCPCTLSLPSGPYTTGPCCLSPWPRPRWPLPICPILPVPWPLPPPPPLVPYPGGFWLTWYPWSSYGRQWQVHRSFELQYYLFINQMWVLSLIPYYNDRVLYFITNKGNMCENYPIHSLTEDTYPFNHKCNW